MSRGGGNNEFHIGKSAVIDGEAGDMMPQWSKAVDDGDKEDDGMCHWCRGDVSAVVNILQVFSGFIEGL